MSVLATTRSRRSGSRSEGRSFVAVFGILFAALPAAILWTLFANVRQAREVRDGWIATPCTVVSSGVREGPNGTWLFSARYRYAFDGRERECADVVPGKTDLSFDEVSRRAGLLADFPAGGAATCLVNPAAPSEAALFPSDADGAGIAAVVLCLFVFVGVSLVVWSLSGRRKDEGADRGKRNRFFGERSIVGAFGAAFFAVGIVVGTLVASSVAETREARSWTEVEATVLRSEVVRETSRSSKGGSSTTYRPYVAYAYEIGGARFENDRYSAAKISTGDPEPSRRVVREHPAGSRATVWVDPEDPSRSVFSDPHGPVPLSLFAVALIPVGFVGFGLAALFAALRGPRDARLAGAPPPPGPPVLRDDRRGQFFRGLLFAAFWNGFLALVFFLARSSNGRVEPALLVFLGVFALVGLVLVGAVVRAAAKLFAPRLELTCGRGCLLRGGEALVVYRLLGGAQGDVVGAKVELVGQRFETVRQGKNTYRKPVDLFRETVFKTDSFRALARGDFRVALPDEAPASARGPEPVRWHFAVELDRPARKPLRDEYEVVVR